MPNNKPPEQTASPSEQAVELRPSSEPSVSEQNPKKDKMEIFFDTVPIIQAARKELKKLQEEYFNEGGFRDEGLRAPIAEAAKNLRLAREESRLEFNIQQAEKAKEAAQKKAKILANEMKEAEKTGAEVPQKELRKAEVDEAVAEGDGEALKEQQLALKSLKEGAKSLRDSWFNENDQGNASGKSPMMGEARLNRSIAKGGTSAKDAVFGGQVAGGAAGLGQEVPKGVAGELKERSKEELVSLAERVLKEGATQVAIETGLDEESLKALAEEHQEDVIKNQPDTSAQSPKNNNSRRRAGVVSSPNPNSVNKGGIDYGAPAVPKGAAEGINRLHGGESAINKYEEAANELKRIEQALADTPKPGMLASPSEKAHYKRLLQDLEGAKAKLEDLGQSEELRGLPNFAKEDEKAKNKREDEKLDEWAGDAKQKLVEDDVPELEDALLAAEDQGVDQLDDNKVATGKPFSQRPQVPSGGGGVNFGSPGTGSSSQTRSPLDRRTFAKGSGAEDGDKIDFIKAYTDGAMTEKGVNTTETPPPQPPEKAPAQDQETVPAADTTRQPKEEASLEALPDSAVLNKDIKNDAAGKKKQNKKPDLYWGIPSPPDDVVNRGDKDTPPPLPELLQSEKDLTAEQKRELSMHLDKQLIDLAKLEGIGNYFKRAALQKEINAVASELVDGDGMDKGKVQDYISSKREAFKNKDTRDAAEAALQQKQVDDALSGGDQLNDDKMSTPTGPFNRPPRPPSGVNSGLHTGVRGTGSNSGTNSPLDGRRTFPKGQGAEDGKNIDFIKAWTNGAMTENDLNTTETPPPQPPEKAPAQDQETVPATQSNKKPKYRPPMRPSSTGSQGMRSGGRREEGINQATAVDETREPPNIDLISAATGGAVTENGLKSTETSQPKAEQPKEAASLEALPDDAILETNQETPPPLPEQQSGKDLSEEDREFIEYLRKKKVEAKTLGNTKREKEIAEALAPYEDEEEEKKQKTATA